jgi:hypothetical protein
MRYIPYYFPTPRPDELLYSLISRFKSHNSFSTIQTKEYLFGNPRAYLSLDIQTRVHDFVHQESHVFPYSAGEIISKFSLWPFYSNFVDKNKHSDFQ